MKIEVKKLIPSLGLIWNSCLELRVPAVAEAINKCKALKQIYLLREVTIFSLPHPASRENGTILREKIRKVIAGPIKVKFL